MKEDFTKYSLWELHQLFPIIEMNVINYDAFDDHSTTVPDYNRWKELLNRIQVEIRSRI